MCYQNANAVFVFLKFGHKAGFRPQGSNGRPQYPPMPCSAFCGRIPEDRSVGQDEQEKAEADMARKTTPRTNGQPSAGYVKSLDKALALLEQIGETDDGLPLSDLAQRAGLPPSTAHRLLTTLRTTPFRAVRQRQPPLVHRRPGLHRRQRLPAAARPHPLGPAVHAAIDGRVRRDREPGRRIQRRGRLPGPCRKPRDDAGLVAARVAGSAAWLGGRQGLAFDHAGARNLAHPAQARSAPADLQHHRVAGRTADRAGRGAGNAGLLSTTRNTPSASAVVAAPIYDERGEAVAAISVLGPTARFTDDRIADLGARVRRAAWAW